MSAGARAVDRELYRWQLDALVSWLRCGRQGVIEAVTGSGKTDVAIAAAADALRRGRFVLILVPSRVLMEQWHGRLTRALPTTRIGRLGDSGRDGPTDCDLLVATRHSAATYRPVPPAGGGLLIADECHGLGGKTLRRAMLPQYEERLGLTATLERSDDGVTELLLPYFGGICYRYGFEQGIADGVCARPRVAFAGVALSDHERADYAAIEQRLVSARSHLRQIRDMPLDPFGAFMAAVAHLAERDAGADGRAAREYLDAFTKRRQIVAQTVGKYELLGRLAPAIKAAEGALVFTETVRAANHAINRLDPHVAVDLITGSTGRARRREILDDLRDRKLDAVAAPRVLDEGIDVPDANLGVVMSASRTRRQMIQRMGRILRRKRAGIAANFVIMFAKDTLEDPANRVESDGFLDEIERISEATGVFDGAHFDELVAFIANPGPPVVRTPEHLESYARGAEPFDAETQYSLLAFAASGASGMRDEAELTRLERALPEPSSKTMYLEPELTNLPAVKKPKVEPTRLSTGEVALQIAVGGCIVAHQLHRLRGSGTIGGVPLASPRPDRALPLRVTEALPLDSTGSLHRWYFRSMEASAESLVPAFHGPDHITFAVVDAEAAIEFFELLGFRKGHVATIDGGEPARYMGMPDMKAQHITLDLDGSDPHFQIQLLRFDPTPDTSTMATATRLQRRGFNHLALRVDDIHAATAHLEAHGVTMLSEEMDYISRQLRLFEGPESITLELVEWVEPG